MNTKRLCIKYTYILTNYKIYHYVWKSAYWRLDAIQPKI